MGRRNERVNVSETVSISRGIAERYAKAVFEIAQETDALAALDGDLADLDEALRASAEIRKVIRSPLVSRGDQESAILAVAERMGLTPVLGNALGLMAQKRRLFVLPQLIAILRDRLARERGEVTAEVVTARPLSTGQVERLKAVLKARVGKDIVIDARVDEDAIGGLAVKVGSRMIDTTIRSKLASLQNAMKGVG